MQLNAHIVNMIIVHAGHVVVYIKVTPSPKTKTNQQVLINHIAQSICVFAHTVTSCKSAFDNSLSLLEELQPDCVFRINFKYKLLFDSRREVKRTRRQNNEKSHWSD